jgi:hypothetical protein
MGQARYGTFHAIFFIAMLNNEFLIQEFLNTAFLRNFSFDFDFICLSGC